MKEDDGESVLVPAHELPEKSARHRGPSEELESAGHTTLVESAIDAIPLLLFIIGADNTYVDFHAGGSSTPFVPPEEFLGKHIRDILPPDVAEILSRKVDEVRTTGRVALCEYSLPGPGGLRSFEARLVPLGERRVAALVTDVFDRRREEAARARRELELQRSLIFSPAIVYSYGLTNGVVTPRSVSANVVRILGYTVEEALSADWWNRSVHPDDRAMADRARDELPGKGHDVSEFRLRDATGAYRWIRQEQLYVDRDRSGTGEVVGAWIDIGTEYQQREALREREARLQTIVDAEPECVKVVAADGSLIEMNPAGLRMLEAASLEEVQRQSLLEFVVPEHRGAFVELSRRVFAGGTGSLEFEVQGLRGTRRWLETSAVPLRDAAGRVTALLGITRDITAHRTADEALRRSEERYRQIIETAGEGVWMIDADSRTSLVNQRMADMLGYTVGEMMGRSMFDLMDEEGKRIAARNVERRKAGIAEEHDFLFRKKDGTGVWTRMLTNPIYDRSGEYAGALGMVSDVSAHRAAELALRSSEERFRALIEHSSDVMMLFDAEGRTTFVSPSFTAALGYKPEEVIGLRPRDLVHPDDQAMAIESHARLMQAPGAVERVVLRTRHRDGYWRTFEAINRNLLHVPSVAAIVSNLRDITEQRRLEAQYQQSQRLDSIGRLAGGIAHDFNNTLTAILSYSELLETDPNGPTKLEDLSEIRRAAVRARDLTQQLLAFARRQVISPKAVDLNDVVRLSERLVRRLLGEDVEVATELTLGLGAVRVDPSQIEQVILNLAINARDAMPTGGKLTIATANVHLGSEAAAAHTEVVEGPHVMLVVSDTGTGIDEKDLPHVFEPFYTTKAVGEGTGLGLATVYGIVKQSGGHIFLSSEPGVGTTFKLYFPRVDRNGTATAAAEHTTSSPRGTETILLVEDDSTVRELTARALREAGYRVLVSESPAEALRLIEGIGGKIDLLLTDVVMPGMSGKALADQIVSRFRRIRVLYVSGYTQNTIVHHGVLDSGVEFLPKPFTPSMLRDAVRGVLDRR